MTRPKFIRLSGWGMVLAALFLLFTFLPERAQIREALYRLFGVPPTAPGFELYQPFYDGVAEMPFLLASLLLTLGLLGLYARYGAQVGRLAKLALMIGVLGGVASALSNLLWNSGAENGRALMKFSLAVMFTGLFVFGLAALRERPMPRWNGLPALAGFWWPLIWTNAYINQATGHLGREVPGWLSFAIFSGMSFCLAWLGYALQADAPAGPEVAA